MSVTGVAKPAVEPEVGLVIATLGAVTFTFTIPEVTTVPTESVTRAVRATMPAAEGVQATEYGALRAVPTTTVPARNSTFATERPAAALALAVSVVEAPTPTPAPLTGVVKLTEGAKAETVTLTPGEVTLNPLLSTTRAVRVTAPTGEAVQVTA